jgi:hypothetical protein
MFQEGNIISILLMIFPFITRMTCLKYILNKCSLKQIIFIIKIPVYCYFLDIFHGPLTDTRYYPVDNLCSVAPLVFLNRKTYLLSDLFWRTWQGVIFSAHSVGLLLSEYTKLRNSVDLLDPFNSDKIILKCHETIFFIE